MTFSQRGIRLAALVLLLTAFVGGTGSHGASAQFRHYDLLNNISASASLDGASIVIDLSNPGAAIPTEAHIQGEYRAMIIVPSSGAVKPVVVEAEGVVYPRTQPQSSQPAIMTADNVSTHPVDLAQFAKYQYVGRMRNHHIGVVTVNYTTRAKDANSLFVFERARLRLVFDSLPPAQPDLGDELTPLDQQLLNAMTINPSDWRALAAPPRPLHKVKPSLDWIERVNSTGKPVLKMRVYEEGVYSLDGDQIRAAGVDPAAFATAQVNLYHKGRPIPVLIQSAGASLQRASRLIFYCPPLDSLSEPWAEFWLIESSGDEESPRIDSLASILTTRYATDEEQDERDDTQYADEAMVRRDFFDHGEYFSSMPNNAPNGMWYSAKLEYLKSREFPFSLTAPSGEGKAAITLYARLFQPSHSTTLEFFINGQSVASRKAQGLAIIEVKAEFAASLLRDGENRLGVVMPESGESSQAPECMFIGYSIEYPHKLIFDESTQIATTFPTGHDILTVPRARSAAIIWDVTDPYETYAIPGIQISHTGGNVEITPIGETRRLMIAMESALKSVSQVRRVERFTLADESQQGDLLIIAHPSLMPGVTSFVEWKRELGFTPLVVNVNDIYDQFDYGQKSDTAIHRYLSYALETWRATPLQWVLLVGEASDYPVAEERAVDKNIQIDMVPTFNFGRPFERVKADSGYALMDDPDLIPDLVISRVPGSTLEETTQAFAKLVDFQRLEQTGPQLYRSMFLADDEPEFEDILEQLITNTIPPSVEPARIYQRNFTYEYYWRVFMRRQSPTATNRIIQAINDGLHTLLFFGHGGPNIWTGERLFHLKDIPLLTNRDKLTFIVAATCNASWLDFPVEPGRHALGERLITHPDGGAYAMFAPTTGTTPSEHEFLMTFLYDAVFKHKIASTGAAMIYSKAYYASIRKNAFVLDQYILTGDATWGVPPLRPDPLPLSVAPEAVNYYERAAVRVNGPMPDMKWGAAAILLTWPNGQSRIVEEKHPIYNGAIDYELQFPADAPPGRYTLTVQGVDSQLGETVVAAQSIELVKPAVKASIAVLPMMPVFDANQEIKTRISLDNLSNVPLNNVTFRVSVDDQVQKEGTVDLPAGAAVHADATIQSQPGARALRAVAEYEIDGRREVVAEAEQVIVTAFPEGGARLYCREDDVELIPESVKPGEAPQIKVQVRNLGRQNLDNLLIEIRNQDNQVISQPALLTLLPERGTKEVVVGLKDPLEIGEHLVSVMIRRASARDNASVDPLILRTVTKRLRIVTGPDLEVIPDSIQFESREFLVGQTVNITGTVLNRGYAPSKEVLIQAFRNKAHIAQYQMKPEYNAPQLTVPPLQPGESHDFTIRWDNNNVVGRQNVVVVVDPNQNGGETFWDNNTAYKPIVIKSPANFTLRSDMTTYAPMVVARRSQVVINTVIENTGMWPSESATFEAIEQGVAGGERPLFEEQMLPALQPGERIEKEIVWRIDRDYPTLEISVNRLRDAAESNHTDNAVTIAPLFVIEGRSLPQTELSGLPDADQSSQTFALSESLALGKFERMYLNPARHMVFVERDAAPESYSVLLSFDHVVNPNVVMNNQEPQTANEDNFWRLEDDVLEAGPEENPPPIQLAVSLPEALMEHRFFDVYVTGQSVPDSANFPSSYAELRAENDKDYRPFDMTESPTPWGTARMRIGRYPVKDGVLDLEVRKRKTGVWTRLYKLDFEPYQAQFTSPAYHFKKPWLGNQTGQFVFTGDNLDAGAMKLMVRCGDELEPGQLVFTEWTVLPWEKAGVSTPFPMTGRHLQFQLRLNAAPSNEPVIRHVHFSLN